MEIRTALCPAKINLTLDVIARRENGYHDIKMIMQAVSLYDRITISTNNNKHITIICNLPYIPKNEKNLAHKAAVAFFEKAGIENPGLLINIYKKIPVSAGLAGGSTNAAGVLIILNELFKTGYTKKELAEIALPLGADIPFTIMGGTCLAEGLGEILTPISPLPDINILIARPMAAISTKQVFSMFDEHTVTERPYTDKMLEALSSGNIDSISHYLYNVLQPISEGICPDIKTTISIINDFAPYSCIMSGSGPSVFAFFDTKEKAEAAGEACKSICNEIHIVKPIKTGAVLLP